ncbi:MAG TPA: hypothetical protein VGM86_03140 [Thermoanaerobaculia bacterium]|jgi:hypothetical protein
MKRAVLIGIVFLLSLRSVMAATPPPILKLSLPFKGTTALAVLDARPDVISGDRKETFVGFSRSLYGIPYPAHTASKQPLAQDLLDLVSRGLKLGGTPAQTVKVSPFSHRDGAIKALQVTGTERLILIEIRDWWTDTLIHTDLHYDLGLTIFNAQGQELGSTSVTGHDELGRRQRPERRDVPTATNDIFSTLFTVDTVTASFASNAQPVVKKTSCTVDQILKMKEAGLTQEQIEAACGSGR